MKTEASDHPALNDLQPPALPSLLHLRTLVRVADHGSLARAARKMLRAPSVVNDGITDLEQALNVPLFERTPQGMRITVYGRVVLLRARRILAELAALPAILGQPPVSVHEQLYLLNARRLEIFVRLCETQHMRSVAAAMGLSQPAISGAVKAMEAGTAKPLFDRRAKGMQPTQVALDILLPIRRALNELRQIPSDLSALSGALSGKVKIGALPLGRTRIVPQAIAQLLSRHPLIQVETSESNFEQMVSDLRGGDLDFIFGALRPDEEFHDLLGEALLDEELVILIRPGHRLDLEQVQLADLAEERWILPRSNSPARMLVEKLFTSHGLAAPRPRVETGDMTIIRGLLAVTDCLAVVSAHQFEREIGAGELKALPLDMSQTLRPIGIISRANSLHSPAAQALIAALREVARTSS